MFKQSSGVHKYTFDFKDFFIFFFMKTGSVNGVNLISLHYAGPLPLLWYVQHVRPPVSENSVLTFSSFMGLAGERVYSGF